jgi:agmatinase
MSHLKKVGSRFLANLGPHSAFLGQRSTEEAFAQARAVIVPVPYDGTTTYRTGTREGPRAILQASRELEFFDEETGAEAYREGIATLEELPVTVSSPKDMVARVREIGDELFGLGKLPVLLGGEHLLSLGMIEAAAARFPGLTVLHLDAHADLREEYQGSSYSNACVMRHVTGYAPIVQVGIRALSKEEYEFIQERNIPCYFAYRLHQTPDLWDAVLSRLEGSVYLSIDLDVFDPSHMPAVGTPEPGGLGWYEVLGLCRRVAQKCNIIGFDVMELLPIPQTIAPDFLAARLVYKLLSYIFMDKAQASC